MQTQDPAKVNMAAPMSKHRLKCQNKNLPPYSIGVSSTGRGVGSNEGHHE